jgi:diguanylate cyclase (GGDEF)-like protein
MGSLKNKISNLKISAKFIGANTIVLLSITILDIRYNAYKETAITQKAARDWTFLFAENVRVSLNTLMREGRMDLRFNMFKAMKNELEGLKDVRVIRGTRTNEIFREVAERDVIPQLEELRQQNLQEVAELEAGLSEMDEYDKEDAVERINELKADVMGVDREIAEARIPTPVDEREKPRDELDRKVLDTGEPLYLFKGDDARVLIPYTAKRETCAQQDGCHKYALEGDVLGAISIEFSIAEINEEIRRNNIKMAGMWLMRFVFFVGLIALLLAFIITNNIHHMLDVFKRMTDGDLSVRAPVKSEDEIGMLADGFNKMASSLEETKKELDRRLLEIYALYNVSKTLNASFETEQLLLRLVQDISRSMNIDRMLVLLYNKKRNELRVASHTGFAEDEVEEAGSAVHNDFYNKVVSTGKSKILTDIVQGGQLSPVEVANKNINSLIAVPFLRRGEVLGLICAFKDAPANFKYSDKKLFNNVAEHLAIALENARLFEQTKKMAITDGLTGMYNKRYFIDVFNAEVERAKRCDHQLSIFMMDLDNFKHYNDSHGHPAGDELLMQLSSIIKESIRKTDIACRYGGEEFVVILPETTKEGAMTVAEKLVEAIHSHPFPHAAEQPLGCVSASIGVATFPDNGLDAEHLLEVADSALYVAKTEGRNRAVSAT